MTPSISMGGNNKNSLGTGRLQNRRLDSWKEIAAYLSRDVRTVIRWEKDRGLPVHRVPGGRKNAVFAYASALDAWLMADASTAQSVLAVLPFANGSGEASLDSLCDGLTESLINRLAQSPDLRVLARSTVFGFKDPRADLRAVGRSLGVPAVVTGIIRQDRGSIIVSAELVNARSGQQRWAGRFVRPASEIWALESELAGALANELLPQLTAAQRERLTRESTRNPEAIRLFWRGRQAAMAYTGDGLQQGIQCFQQAIDLDPKYARAHAALAEVYGFMALGYSTERPAPQLTALAQQSARTALAIDPSLAEAHCALGLSLMHTYNLQRIEECFQQAIALQPGYALVRALFAYARLCRCDFPEAIRQAERALEVDPAAHATQVDCAAIIAYAGDLARAREIMDRVQARLPGPATDLPPWMYVSGLIHQLQGEIPQAIEVLERCTTGDIMHTIPLGILGYCHGRGGAGEKAAAVLQRLSDLPPERYTVHFSKAVIFAGLGDIERTLGSLERGFEEKNPWLFMMNMAPWFAQIRSHPRFRAISAQLRL